MLILGPKSLQLSTLTIRVQVIVTTRDQHKCDLTEHKLGFVDNIILWIKSMEKRCTSHHIIQ